MTSDPPVGVRAGFLRRVFASLIDLIIIYVPFQLIVPFLFAATAGHIQMSTPILFYGECSVSKLETVPEGFPAGSNFTRECNIYFLGAQTARILQVGRLNIEGTTAQSVALNYMLDRDGHLINGVSADWIAMLALITYLVAMETRTGATLGSRAMRIRVIDAATPVGPNVPLRKIVLRDRWNQDLAEGCEPWWSPTIRAAIVRRYAVARSALSRLPDKPCHRHSHHRPSSTGISRKCVLRLLCSWCGRAAPMPKIHGLHALPR